MTATGSSTRLGTQDVSSGIRSTTGAVVITKNVANMHASPDRSSELVSQAILGQIVLAFEETDGWLRVKTQDEYTGWVESRWTTPDVRGRSYASSGKIVRLRNLFANILVWPDRTADIITKAVVGTELEIADEQDDWVVVRLPDGKPGSVRRFAIEMVDRAVYPLPLMPTGSEIAATAKRFVGVPYLWGGASPFGLDCSGFVQMVHKLHGVLLPRDAYLQAQDNSFRDVKPETVMAGDLLFFGSAQDALAKRSITHVGIALAGGRFIHSSCGAGVNISEISDSYYAPMLRMVRRLI